MIKLSVITIGIIIVAGSLMGMSILKKKYCVFSRFEGVLTFEGKPVSGVKIVRKMLHDEKTNEYRIAEETVTNDKGEFKFDSRWEKIYVSPIFDHRVFQRVFAYYEGEEMIIWDHAKAFKEEYADFGGEYKNLICELTDNYNYRRTDQTSVYKVTSKCQWEVTKPFDFIKHL